MSEIKRNDEIAGPIVHEYDGIEEADNRLPRWGLGIFLASVVFAAMYWMVYHEFEIAPSPLAAYQAALSEETGGKVTEEILLAAAQNPSNVQEGKALFATHCAVCHEADGRGKIGPNLTDEYWLHGDKPLDMYNVVDQGVLTKGMPAWGRSLGPLAVQKAIAFVLSIRNTHAAGGKAPQGQAPSQGTSTAAVSPQAQGG